MLAVSGFEEANDDDNTIVCFGLGRRFNNIYLYSVVLLKLKVPSMNLTFVINSKKCLFCKENVCMLLNLCMWY